MNRLAAMAHAFSRRFTAVLVLVSCLLLPITPILQTLSSSRREACECCRRTAAKCSHQKVRAESGSGIFFDSSTQCGDRCVPPIGAMPALPYFVAKSRLALGLPPAAAQLIELTESGRHQISYSAWLYQRPPPVNRSAA